MADSLPDGDSILPDQGVMLVVRRLIGRCPRNAFGGGGDMTHSSRNTLKTAMLLGLLSALILVVGQALGGSSGLVLAGVFTLLMNGGAYFASDKLALRAMRAEPVTAEQAPRLHAIVAELAGARGLPMPRVYLSPTAAPNAFATGRNPDHAVVCVTSGIMEILDERELRGVLGHEISHVGNRDILIATVAAGLASMLMILVQFAQFGALFGFGRGDDDGPNIFELLLLMLLGPLAAGLLQAAISRSREYQADASGAQLTGDPLALASALRRIEAGVKARPLAPNSQLGPASALMIANPFAGEGMLRLFSTHPATDERIARLEAMARGTTTS
jgi:heat shock protein HtpX